MNNILARKYYFIPLSSARYYLYLFLLWPFLAFLLAVKNYSQKESRVVVYLFLIYFGLTYVVPLGSFNDAVRYAMQLKTNALLPFSDIFKIVGGLYSSDTSVDFVEPLISFIVSRFTSNKSILFAAYTALFGFFYLKSIGLLYRRVMKTNGINSIIHLAFFTAILPVTAINGFRMWTAAWIFFYGAYHVVLYRDARYLLLTISASLVHFSFLTANLILIIYYLAGNRNYIYLPMALISFVVPHLIAPAFQSISTILGGGFQSRFESYTGEDYMAARHEAFQQTAWFLKIGYDLVWYYLMFAIIFIQLRYSSYMKQKEERNLFSFILLFLTFVNFGTAIPSFGGRFLIVFFLFATLYLVMFFAKSDGNRLHLLSWFGLFPMVLFAAIVFRQGAESINAWIFAPGFGLPFFAPDVSVADLLFN